MMINTKRIREFISCPQFGDDHYGEWGALRADQRYKIKELIDYIDNLENSLEEYNKKEKGETMKLMISQPMRGKTEEEILKERDYISEYVSRNYKDFGINEPLYIMNTLVADKAPKDKDEAVYYLSKSIEFLSEADIIVFASGYKNARGCLIEESVAKSYGKKVIYMPETKVTQKDIDNILSKMLVKCEKYGDKTTIVKATLPNGFVIVESSSCVDPNNFDMSTGQQICMDKIVDKIWELEGYKLQSSINEEKEGE